MKTRAVNIFTAGFFFCILFPNVGIATIRFDSSTEKKILSLEPNYAHSSIAAGSIQQAKRLFEIPPYPGTTAFKESSQLKRLHLPFATSVLVYRTTDGKGFDKEKVIDFYRNHLTNKGWKDDIFERRGDEAYLGMRVDLFESVKGGAQVHLSGKFYLWIAPSDGMYTIILDQWRLSSPGQETLTYLNRVEGALEAISVNARYRVQKTYSDGEWDLHYQNEYLTDRRRFGFFANESTRPHPRPNQAMDLIILSYLDSTIAEEEARRLKPSKSELPGSGRIVFWGGGSLLTTSPAINIVHVKNNTVFLIRDHSGLQEQAANQIAAEIEKL